MTIRHDWSRDEVAALFERPFNELLFAAQQLHRTHHDPDAIQVSEDCGYCPQSAHHDTTLERERLMAVDEVVEAARQAHAAGATRFCMGAAWRSPRDSDIELVASMVREVKALGMETCLTLGMLSDAQAGALRCARSRRSAWRPA
jgi:biotin synthase